VKSGCFDSYVELTSLYDKRLARNRGRIAFSALRKHEESQFVACMDDGVFRPMEVRRCVESASGPEQFVGERGAPPVSRSANASLIYGYPRASLNVPALDCVSNSRIGLHRVAHAVTPANDDGKIAAVNQHRPVSLCVFKG